MMPNGCRRSPSSRMTPSEARPFGWSEWMRSLHGYLGTAAARWSGTPPGDVQGWSVTCSGSAASATLTWSPREQPGLPAAVRAAGDADAAWHGDPGVGQEAHQVLRVADLKAAVSQMCPSLRARGVRSGLGTARAVEAPRRVVEDGIAAGDEGNVVVAVLVGAGVVDRRRLPVGLAAAPAVHHDQQRARRDRPLGHRQVDVERDAVE